jgi:hypothetical protein
MAVKAWQTQPRYLSEFIEAVLLQRPSVASNVHNPASIADSVTGRSRRIRLPLYRTRRLRAS